MVGVHVLPVVAHDSFQQVGAAAALQLLTCVIVPVCPDGQAKVRDVEAGAGPHTGVQVLLVVVQTLVAAQALHVDQVPQV